MKRILNTLIIASTFAAGTAMAEPAVGPDNNWLTGQTVSAPPPSVAFQEDLEGGGAEAVQTSDRHTMRTEHLHAADVETSDPVSFNP